MPILHIPLVNVRSSGFAAQASSWATNHQGGEQTAHSRTTHQICPDSHIRSVPGAHFPLPSIPHAYFRKHSFSCRPCILRARRPRNRSHCATYRAEAGGRCVLQAIRERSASSSLLEVMKTIRTLEREGVGFLKAIRRTRHSARALFHDTALCAARIRYGKHFFGFAAPQRPACQHRGEIALQQQPTAFFRAAHG